MILVTYLQCVSILLLCKQNISQINEKQVLIKLSKIFLYLSSSLPDLNGHHHRHHQHYHYDHHHLHETIIQGNLKFHTKIKTLPLESNVLQIVNVTSL